MAESGPERNEAKASKSAAPARRRTWDFALLSIIAACITAVLGLTALIHSTQTKATVSAETHDLVVELDAGNSAHRPPPFLENTHVRRVVIDALTPFNLCSATIAATDGCRPVNDILINFLATDAKATVMLQAQSDCFLIRVKDGHAQMQMVQFSGAATSSSAPPPNDIELGSKDRARICTGDPMLLNFTDVTSVKFARSADTGGSVNDLPTLQGGTLSFPEFGKNIRLTPTDVLSLEFVKAGGVVSVQIGRTASVGLVGQVAKASLGYASVKDDVMPSWYDWLTNSSWIKATISLIGAIFAALWGIREKISPETKK
jgi:hypothetical protein